MPTYPTFQPIQQTFGKGVSNLIQPAVQPDVCVAYRYPVNIQSIQPSNLIYLIDIYVYIRGTYIVDSLYGKRLDGWMVGW
jgi:hypothetical protein